MSGPDLPLFDCICRGCGTFASARKKDPLGRYIEWWAAEDECMSCYRKRCYMIERHFHWDFTAYNGDIVNERIPWAVTVNVIGFLSEADALLAAKDIVQRDHYQLSRVWECSSCGFNQQNAESLRKMAGTLE